ncbi:hypothetical protein GBA65_05845 [Rubrobacter marinus]|uniref:Uncharacterized protein n=1 Tax=Rubrobacter marinus TaxID=2653852 RepID=A0A6G8PV79_9ACTN|nr:hypothetical protein GBA65_05845 [Rubrobacter marinus]
MSRARDEEGFERSFDVRARPARLAPWRLAAVRAMQDAEGLSDRRAAEAMRARTDRKYAPV